MLYYVQATCSVNAVKARPPSGCANRSRRGSPAQRLTGRGRRSGGVGRDVPRAERTDGRARAPGRARGMELRARLGRSRPRERQFLAIRGLHVRTTYGHVGEWSQPIIHQPEEGILGFLARELDGLLHFLVQVKAEPGNVNVVQISPTVQATRSNYLHVHNGERGSVPRALRRPEGARSSTCRNPRMARGSSRSGTATWWSRSATRSTTTRRSRGSRSGRSRSCSSGRTLSTWTPEPSSRACGRTARSAAGPTAAPRSGSPVAARTTSCRRGSRHCARSRAGGGSRMRSGTRPASTSASSAWRSARDWWRSCSAGSTAFRTCSRAPTCGPATERLSRSGRRCSALRRTSPRTPSGDRICSTSSRRMRSSSATTCVSRRRAAASSTRSRAT
jgi:NDP-hexose 2,3-dehydratase